MPPYRVFVDHGEAYGNLGDEAMLVSALARLRRHLGDCVFVIPREGNRPLPALGSFAVEHVPSPFVSFARASARLEWLTGRLARLRLMRVDGLQWRLRAATALAKREVQSHLRGCDAFYGVGAADFNDFNALGAAYKCWLYDVARPLVRVAAVSAQGIGPVRNAELAGLMRRTFDRLDLLSFRDCRYSAEFVSSLGALSCRTRIVGDEAFSLTPAENAARDRYLAEAGLSPDEPFIAVHWRATDYVQETAWLYSRVAKIFQAASRRHGLPLVFFPMSYDVHSRHDDECCAAIRQLMDEPARLLMAPPNRDVALVKAAIGASRFTLGLSYHVHVFGLSQGVPAIIAYSGDYYRFKSEGLAGFYAAPTAAADIADAQGEAGAMRAIEALRGVGPEVREDIVTRNRSILASNDWTIAEMSRLLRDRGR